VEHGHWGLRMIRMAPSLRRRRMEIWPCNMRRCLGWVCRTTNDPALMILLLLQVLRCLARCCRRCCGDCAFAPTTCCLPCCCRFCFDCFQHSPNVALFNHRIPWASDTGTGGGSGFLQTEGRSLEAVTSHARALNWAHTCFVSSAFPIPGIGSSPGLSN